MTAPKNRFDGRQVVEHAGHTRLVLDEDAQRGAFALAENAANVGNAVANRYAHHRRSRPGLTPDFVARKCESGCMPANRSVEVARGERQLRQ
jgi:hypothetical protein